MTATSHAGLLVIVAMLWERFRGAPRQRRLGLYVALAGAASLGLFVASGMHASPHTRNVWILAGGETPKRRSEQEYFDSFKSYDFFPWEMRQTADYLARITSPETRIQTYGMDPYLLFLARRRSATPYIYAYDLDDDAALDGGWSNHPTDAQIAIIKATRDAHERDLVSRLEHAPPEVFVFADDSPLMTYHDAWEDFRHCCADASRFVATRYHPAKSWGGFHVWVRDDLTSRIPDVERGGVP
jgi:hypothetical protein